MAQYEDVGLRARIDGVSGYLSDGKKIEAENKRIEQSLKDSATGMNREASSIINSLKPIAGAIAGAFAVKAGVDMFAGAVSAASDLSETINKVNVVFGDSSGAVLKFAETAAQSLGMSRNEALASAATFGNLFASMGLGEKQSADFSQNLLKLSADLGSFNNIDPTEVLEKLRSGLVGETEPLRSLGILLDEESVKQFAYANGIAKVGSELTQQQKVMGRYGLILQQSATAQGDFANTSTGIANSSRIISASFKDIQAEIGSRLLPVIQPLISNFAQALPAAFAAVQPWLDRIGNGITEFASSLQGGGFQQLQGAIQPVLNIFAQLGGDLLQFAQSAGPSVISIFQQIGGTLLQLNPFLEMVRSGWQSLTEFMNADQGGMMAFEGILDGIAGALKAAADPFGELQTKVRDFATTMTGTFNTLRDQAMPVIESIGSELVKTWAELGPLIKPAIDGVVKVVQDALAGMAAFWEQHGNQILTVTKAAFEAIGSTINGTLQVITAVVKPFLKVLAGDWQGAWAEIQKVPGVVMTAVQGQIDAGLKLAKQVMRLGVEALRLEDAWYGLRDFVLTVWHNLVEGIKTEMNAAIDAINTVTGKATAALATITGKRIEIDLQIPKMAANALALPGRPSFFGTDAQQDAEIAAFKRKVEDAQILSTPRTIDPADLFDTNPELAALMELRRAEEEAANAGENVKQKAQRAAIATAAIGDGGKKAADAIKQALKDAEYAVDDYIKALEAGIRELSAQIRIVDAQIKGMGRIRFTGMDEAEDEIFALEQAAKKAQIRMLEEETGQDVAKKIKEGAKELGESFDMLSAQQREVREGIPVALQKWQWEQEQAKKAAERAIAKAAQPSKETGTREKTAAEREFEAAQKALTLKRLKTEAEFEPKIRAWDKRFKKLTGAEPPTFASPEEAEAKLQPLLDKWSQLTEEEQAAQLKLLDAKAVKEDINRLQREEKISLDEVEAIQGRVNELVNGRVTAEELVTQELGEQLELMRQAEAIAQAAWGDESIGPPAGPAGDEFPGMATGGRVLVGGGATVGERGAERVILPAGAAVLPAGSGGATVNRSSTDIWNIDGSRSPIDTADQVYRRLKFDRLRAGRDDW